MTQPVARESPVWDHEPAPICPALTGEVRADVCVVGLGGSGLACLRELHRLGVHAIGVDAGRVGGGAAGRNGGFLLAGLSHFHHDAVARVGRSRAVAMYRLTLDELDRIVAESPETVRRGGSLRIAESDAELRDCEAQLAQMQADGLPVEWYSGPEGDGLLLPADGTFQPLARCRQLAAAAIADGVTLYERSRAVEVAAGHVRGDAGAVRCRSVIVAVDGGLERILPELAGRVRTARLQMLATAPTREIRLERPVYARWGYDYWQQRPDGVIALGGARDLAGDSEWTTDATPTLEVQTLLEHRLRTTLGVTAPVTHRWAASVGYTHDGLPVLAEVRDGVWAAGAYSGTGNVVGALLGRGLARLLAAGDDALVRPFLAADA